MTTRRDFLAAAFPALASGRGLAQHSTEELLAEVLNRTDYAGRFDGALHLRGDFTAESQWTEWTPTWTAVTTDPVIGNGTLAGRYVRYGQLVHLQIHMLAGSTTTFGSGGWWFNLPVDQQVTGTGPRAVGTAFAWGADNHSGVVWNQASNDTMNVYSDQSGQTPWQSTTPFTWASGDYLHLSISYETKRLL